MTTTQSPPIERRGLRRLAMVLAAATITWNVIEAGVSLAAGAAAGSVALITFGIDALIEVGSASVVLWQYSGHDSDARSRSALKAIAVSFFALAAYAGTQGVHDLATGSEPDASVAGIAIAALSLVVMPLLAIQKRWVGRKLGSNTVMADSAQTILCTYLSAALLAGLALNAAFGWWWADPLVALVVAALAIAEGREAWNGDADCCATLGSNKANQVPADRTPDRTPKHPAEQGQRRSFGTDSRTAVDLVGRYSNPDELLRRFERLRRSARRKRVGATRQPRRTQTRLAEDEISELISRHQRGDTIDELAGRFGIHRTTVMTHLDRHGVERRTGNVQRRIDEALRLYESGWSLARIGTEFGVNAETVRRALRGAGVSMRPRPGG